MHPRVRDFLETKIRSVDNPEELFSSWSDEFREHIERVHRGEEDLRFPPGTENHDLIKRRILSEEDIRSLGWDCISFFVNKTGPDPQHSSPLEFATELILLDPPSQIKSFRERALSLSGP